MLQNARARSEDPLSGNWGLTAGGLCFICLGLRKEKVIDMGSTLPFCSAFLAFRNPVSSRNCVLFGIEVHRQMWT